MANVSFDQETQYAAPMAVVKKPFLVRLILSTNIVKTDRQAEYVLIGIGILALIIAIVVWPKGTPEPRNVVPVAVPQPTNSQ